MPVITAFSVSVPSPPFRTSVEPHVPAAAVKVWLPPPAANEAPVSAPVVSDLKHGFDTLLILNSFLSILLDIKHIAYDAPILNCKSR